MLTPATSQDYYPELQICNAGCLAGRERPAAFDGYQGMAVLMTNLLGAPKRMAPLVKLSIAEKTPA